MPQNDKEQVFDEMLSALEAAEKRLSQLTSSTQKQYAVYTQVRDVIKKAKGL